MNTISMPVPNQGSPNTLLLGILFIILALVIFATEVVTPTYGVLAALGVITLIIGGLILFTGGPAFLLVSPWLVVALLIIFAIFLFFAIKRSILAQRRQPITGQESVIGKTAIVKVALKPAGTVFYDGTLWTAVIDKGQPEPDEEVIIIKTEGLKFYVTKKQ